ncbi:3578_t:CDS:2 [Ambispora gerdemannii]|uniref:Protein arginine methyltransferase NDUFAF7 n=1 Tax=Ambispora gerdemannii TaxID=144530 RepID=A0A9N9FJ64_9GLOM|nr:3578_t:CDS:2 [Ambispora gerdemannii]
MRVINMLRQCSNKVSRSFNFSSHVLMFRPINKRKPSIRKYTTVPSRLISFDLRELFEQPRNLDYASKYQLITALDAAKTDTIPKCSLMLVRDFIDNSLYNPYYGYFSKQAVIFSPENFNFINIKDNLQFMRMLSKTYAVIENEMNETDKVARQVWHTSTELFKPWYGYAVAKHIVEKYKATEQNPHHELIIYEMGAGNGTLMLNILDYIKQYEHSIYQQTRYRSIFEWNEIEPNPCFFIAFEVLDNFAHDAICYDTETEEPLQGIVITDEKGEYEDVYEPVTDPLILRYLSTRDKTSYKTPVLHKWRALRKLRHRMPFAPSLTKPEFLPTKALLFLEIINEYFPRHRLLISDFFKLPETIPGVDAPVVQTRFERTMVPCSTYMVQPGYFDIFFPTNFELLKNIYQVLRAGGKSDGNIQSQEIQVSTQKDFLKKYADLEKTRTRSGENPMLLYYENIKFLFT